MLDGRIFDSTEAKTVSTFANATDIYSLSWGPGEYFGGSTYLESVNRLHYFRRQW